MPGGASVRQASPGKSHRQRCSQRKVGVARGGAMTCWLNAAGVNAFARIGHVRIHQVSWRSTSSHGAFMTAIFLSLATLCSTLGGGLLALKFRDSLHYLLTLLWACC